MATGPSDIGIVSMAANHGGLQIIARRVEENVARAILRDLWENGLVIVVQSRYERAERLANAVREMAKADYGTD